jgi:hypothetical protein
VRILWPAYVHPAVEAEWAQALEQLGAGDIAVINPSSGPGVEMDLAWVRRVEQLHDRGVLVAGYVSTSYGARDWRACVDDAAGYRRLGYRIDLVFYDEIAGTEPFGALRGLHGYSRSLMPPRQGMSVFNLGRPHDEATRPLSMALAGSIWVTFESAAAQYPITPHPDRSREAHLVYSATPTLGAAVTRQADIDGVGFLYVTPDDLINPYDTWKGEG